MNVVLARVAITSVHAEGDAAISFDHPCVMVQASLDSSLCVVDVGMVCVSLLYTSLCELVVHASSFQLLSFPQLLW